MCGISGFTGVKNLNTRVKLIKGFGPSIDRRGYAAAGFVTSNEAGEITFQRKVLGWTRADEEFILAAASGDMCMMHSRGPWTSVDTDAHPFPVSRDGKIVLWGAHNGELDQAWESARHHNRDITVDSMELFELIADAQYNQLNTMYGWGVAEWVEASSPRQVKLACISDYADLVAVSLVGGGAAWASTMDILKIGLTNAGLSIKEHYPILGNTGRVFVANEEGIFPTEDTRVYTKNQMAFWK